MYQHFQRKSLKIMELPFLHWEGNPPTTRPDPSVCHHSGILNASMIALHGAVYVFVLRLRLFTSTNLTITRGIVYTATD